MWLIGYCSSSPIIGAMVRCVENKQFENMQRCNSMITGSSIDIEGEVDGSGRQRKFI